MNSGSPRIAYFSMEIALDPELPTYSGGLGILAGDTLRSAADLGVPIVGVTLVHHKGYFRQRLDAAGNQSEEPDSWNPAKRLEPMEPRVSVAIEGRAVELRAWHYSVHGLNGRRLPVYLLDTALPQNSPYDQTLTDSLYGGDQRYRLCQEVVLGMGGVAMLRALGHTQVESYHMNEGHSALLALALLQHELGPGGVDRPDHAMEHVRPKCIFTTHTPVPAGHDQFSKDLARSVLGAEAADLLEATGCCHGGTLNMTYLALRCSHYINGVAMHHGEISRGMFPRYSIRAITNGVHASTWASPPFQSLYDQHVPEWRRDNRYLRYAVGIPLEEIRDAHLAAKRALFEQLRQAMGVQLDEEVLTIGLARRATAYKRLDLFLRDRERLASIARQVGPVQVVMAGKAHPRDQSGRQMIRQIFLAREALKGTVEVVYVEDYDMRWAQRLVAGSDLWLNTPKPPHEASGTSGMKAALNGVPSLSVLDGWWIEGHLEGLTGWAIGDDGKPADDDTVGANLLLDKLERTIVPLYYAQPQQFAKVMRSAIALNGSFFNTQRMISQYMSNAYFPAE